MIKIFIAMSLIAFIIAFVLFVINIIDNDIRKHPRSRRIVITSLALIVISILTFVESVSSDSSRDNLRAYDKDIGIVKQGNITNDIGFLYLQMNSGKSIAIHSFCPDSESKKKVLSMAHKILDSKDYENNVYFYGTPYFKGDTLYAYYCRQYFFFGVPKPFTKKLVVSRDKVVKRELEYIESSGKISDGLTTEKQN